jgi:hypothetical protein
VAWNTITKPSDMGGLGIRNLNFFTKALRMKKAWNILLGETLFSNLMKNLYPPLQHSTIPHRISLLRDAIIQLRPYICWESMHEGNLDLWTDIWIKDTPLKDLLPMDTSPDQI